MCTRLNACSVLLYGVTSCFSFWCPCQQVSTCKVIQGTSYHHFTSHLNYGWTVTINVLISINLFSSIASIILSNFILKSCDDLIMLGITLT